MLHRHDKKNHEELHEELKDKEPKEIIISQDEFNALKQDAQQCNEYKDKLLRLQAEFDNARKRLERERFEFVKYANEGIISELLGILDDLERSVTAAEAKHEDLNAFLKGVEMILAHLYEMLKKKGITPIDAKGRKFDPHLHEAMMQVETDEFPEDIVVEELQKGYKLEDRVIRTSKVKVATAKAAKEPQKPQKDGEGRT